MGGLHDEVHAAIAEDLLDGESEGFSFTVQQFRDGNQLGDDFEAFFHEHTPEDIGNDPRRTRTIEQFRRGDLWVDHELDVKLKDRFKVPSVTDHFWIVEDLGNNTNVLKKISLRRAASQHRT